MSTKIQILRNVGTAVVAAPTLLEGELAYSKSGFIGGGAANALIIGDGTSHQVLIGSDRQLELTGNQVIASGTKEFAAGAKLATSSSPTVRAICRGALPRSLSRATARPSSTTATAPCRLTRPLSLTASPSSTTLASCRLAKPSRLTLKPVRRTSSSTRQS
jgi:hypothetical protein